MFRTRLCKNQGSAGSERTAEKPTGTKIHYRISYKTKKIQYFLKFDTFMDENEIGRKVCGKA